MVHINQGVSINWADPGPSPRQDTSSKGSHSVNNLAAIILATKSSRGETVVFHYPPEPQFDNRSSDFLNEADSDSDIDPEFNLTQRRSDGGRGSDNIHLPTINEGGPTPEAGQEEWVPAWRKIFGLESSLLADIFTPQKSDVKFEMWIDNLVFLGRPVHRRFDGTWINLETEQNRGGDYEETLDRKIIKRFQESMAYAQIDPEQNLLEDLHSGSQSHMTSFHLVFALNASIDHKYQQYITDMYQHVVNQLTVALMYEQAQSAYVWKQCELIRSIKHKGETTRTNIATVWHDILRESDLAEVIQQTYSAIANNEIAHLLVNDRLSLSLALPRQLKANLLPADTDSEHPFLNSGLMFAESIVEVDPTIMPHYGLIFLDDVDVILASLPIPKPWPLMTKFIKRAVPTKSFVELAETMQVAIEEIISLARCLLKWRCALPTIPLSERYLYLTSPTADMTQLPRHAQIFARKFPAMPPLPTMLANMSRQSGPYSVFIPDEAQTDLYLEGLAWMIKEKWLLQLRTFVWIKIRAEIKAAVARDQLVKENKDDDPWRAAEDGVLHEEMFEDTILSDPYNSTQQERLWLEKLEVRHPMADAALFRKVRKYFNGKHAIEKIIVRENIEPRALRRLLDIFEEDLVKCSTW